jgi:ribosomal protein L20
MSRTNRRYRKREGRKVWVFSELRESPDQHLLNDALIQHSLEQAQLEIEARQAHQLADPSGEEVDHDASS